MADKVDHILLFSGDGDFRRLVEALQRRGVRVTVISTIKAQPPMVADELRRQADNFIELYDLAPHIQRSAPSPRSGGAEAGGKDDPSSHRQTACPEGPHAGARTAGAGLPAGPRPHS